MPETYISRDYAVENMETFPWDTEHDKNAAIHLVRELVPAADVRPVVFCEACEFRRSSPVLYCGRTDGLNNITLTDFCSKGIRRPDL